MLQRSQDSEFLNSIVHLPEVYEAVSLGFKGEIDVAGAVKNPDNVFLANEFGGFLFIKQPGDCYEVHTQFAKEGRGKQAYLAAEEAAWYMFTKTPCLMIKTLVPKGNVRAAALTLKMGFSHWETVYLNGIESKVYALTLKMWVKRLRREQCLSQPSQ